MRHRRPVARRPWVEQLEGRLVPSTSSNWSGYAVLAPRNAVTAVSGSWVVPKVSGTSTTTAYSSAWVGIDGDGSGTVEQIGTDSDVVNGKATYYAWYEMYPAPAVNLSQAVNPGDTITASVSFGSGSRFTLTIDDSSWASPFTTTQNVPRRSTAARSSADWVQEAPSSGFGTLPLANFGSVTFSAAQLTLVDLTGKPTTGPVDGKFPSATSVDEISLKQQGTLVAVPAALTDSGSPATSSFTVTFHAPAKTTGRGTSPTGRLQQPDVILAQPIAGPFAGAGAAFPTTVAGAQPQGLTAGPPAQATTNGAVSFGQLGGALGGHTPDTGPADGAPVTPPAVPELLPPPTELGRPGGERVAPPTNPDAVPAPSDDESPASLEGSAAVWRGACDACFVDGRWAPAAPESGGRAGVGGDEGTSAGAAAGVLLALTLGGSWGASREHGSGRRRRPRLH